MKRTNSILVFIFCTFFSLNIFAQSAHSLIRDGNTAFEKKKFAEAEEFYRKAVEIEGSGKAVYNLGNALYAQGRYEEAIPKYADASRIAPNKSAKSGSFHNLGNAHFQHGELEEAIEAYKDALRLNPADSDTKYNLARAQRQQRQQKEQEQKQEQQDQENKDENQENQENKEDQEQQDQEDQKENQEKESEEQEQQQ